MARIYSDEEKEGYLVKYHESGMSKDEEVTHAEYWTHARRKFYDSIPLINRQMDKTSAGYEVVEIIDEIFKQEDIIEEQLAPSIAPDEWIKQKFELRKEKNYLLEILTQLEGEQKDTDIEKYLPWSEELPDEIRNYEEEYTELNLE